MAPKVTTSAERSKRKSAKPVTKGQSPQRANRQSVSGAKITTNNAFGRGGQWEAKKGDMQWSKSSPKPPARVTNANQRVSTGSAKVTSGSRPALPPGKKGGELARSSSPAPKAIPGKPTPKALPGGTGGADSVRGSGVRTGRPGATRPALPASATTAAAKSKLLGKGAVGTAIVGSILNAPEEIRKGVRLAKDPKGAVSDVVKGLGLTMFDKKGGVKPDANNRSSRGIRVSDTRRTVPTGSQEYNDFRRNQIESEKQRLKNVGNPPAAVTRSSSSNSSSSPSRSSSTQRSASSSSTSSSTTSSSTSTSGTPAKPGQEWKNWNPGRGTSKTNNPLMKDMIKRMKDREDKEQASKAQQLTDKSRQNSGYTSAENVDGSKYADELKKKKGFNFSVSS